MHGIISRVNTEIESVTVGKLVCKFGVNVIKIISATVIRIVLLLPGGVLDKRLGQNIEVSTTQRNIKCGFFFHDGPFHLEFRRKCPDAGCPADLFIVAVFHAHIHHRRKPSSETCREATFIKRYVFKRITVENGKKAHHVIHVVERDTVQE
ncbi:hypothetical protein SDC9_161160 [bioreactor metagenome]|uniref:Uncharacterized protein n=1 Tax=bioreactor metagenome TaxID=1076179 RepID=A0A645FND5_9ZZZZ